MHKRDRHLIAINQVHPAGFFFLSDRTSITDISLCQLGGEVWICNFPAFRVKVVAVCLALGDSGAFQLV